MESIYKQTKLVDLVSDSEDEGFHGFVPEKDEDLFSFCCQSPSSSEKASIFLHDHSYDGIYPKDNRRQLKPFFISSETILKRRENCKIFFF